MNPMKQIKVEKLTLNFGSGKEQAKLERGMILLKHITGKEPVKTITKKRIPAWGLRPGLPVGCKITLRGKECMELIPRLLDAKKRKLEPSDFDDNGNVSFSVPEYIEIPDVQYEPKVGITGFNVCVTLTRPGFRIAKRRIRKAKVPRKHKIDKEEAMEFMKESFQAQIGG